MSRLYWDEGPRGGKVLLATTAYENPDASYTNSIQCSREALTGAGINSAYLLLSGNCHVDDARNVVVQEFLLSDCTDLIFLDADVSWQPQDLVQLCKYDVDIVGGVYPFRASDRDGMPVRMVRDNFDIHDGLIEVEGVPTGFMKIQRHVIEKMAATSQSFINRGDHRSNVPLLFERAFRDGGRFGGDLNFCAKWRDMGGKVYAAAELRLGHVAKEVITDSLGASLRRVNGETLTHILDRIRNGTEKPSDYSELLDWYDNKFAAVGSVLATVTILARKSTGPIIEAGSGLTTILMAAATDQTVFCLEHDPIWAEKLRQMAREGNLTNIGLCHSPLKDNWYDLSDCDLPRKFSLGVCDGPPRHFRSRTKFLTELGDKCTYLLFDDMDDSNYYAAIKTWAEENNRTLEMLSPRCALVGMEIQIRGCPKRWR